MLRESDPRNVLSKGYAAVTDKSGAVIATVKDVKPGDDYIVRMTDGSFVAKAVEILGDTPDSRKEK